MPAWIAKILSAIFGNDVIQTVVKATFGTIAVELVNLAFHGIRALPGMQAMGGMNVEPTDFPKIVDSMLSNGDITEQAAQSLTDVYSYLQGDSASVKTLATIAVVFRYFTMTAKSGTGQIEQQYNQRNRPNLPDADIVAEALHFGTDNMPEVVDILQRHGISDNDIATLQKSLRTPLGAPTILQLLLNETIGEQEAVTLLQYTGLTESDSYLYIQSPPAAPISSVIAGLLSGQVLDDNVALNLGLDSDRPAVLSSWLKANGIPESFVSLYWRAHYQLPPIDMVYAAYNRGQISIDDMHTYYSAVNMPPALYPILDALSSTPISMLQAAEALQNGIIQPDRFQQIAKENGFSVDATAVLLQVAQSTLNSNVTSQTIQGISYAISDGFIDDVQGQKMFQSLGMTSDQASMQVELAHYNASYQFLNTSLSTIETAFKNRKIDGNTANAQLVALGLLPSKAQAYLNLWSEQALSNSKVPTPTDIKDMLKYNIINESEAVTYLGQNGYDPTTAARLAALYLASNGG